MCIISFLISLLLRFAHSKDHYPGIFTYRFAPKQKAVNFVKKSSHRLKKSCSPKWHSGQHSQMKELHIDIMKIFSGNCQTLNTKNMFNFPLCAQVGSLFPVPVDERIMPERLNAKSYSRHPWLQTCNDRQLQPVLH